MTPPSPIHRSHAQTRSENERRARALKRDSNFDKEAALKVAHALDKCIKRAARRINRGRCDQPLAACAQCAGLARRKFVPDAMAFMGSKAAQIGTPVMITIIPPGEAVAIDKMPTWSLNNFTRRVKAKLTRVPLDLLPFALGGVDISLNIDRTGQDPKIETHYAPHLHLVGVTACKDLLAAALRKEFGPATAEVLRPVKVTVLDLSEYAVSYLLKDHFEARVSLIDQKGRRNTVRERLKTREKDQLQRLLVALHRSGKSDLAFCFRCRWLPSGIHRITGRTKGVSTALSR